MRKPLTIVISLAFVGLAGCGSTDSTKSTTATSGTSAPSTGDLWTSCMVQGEMASCQEIWKTL